MSKEVLNKIRVLRDSQGITQDYLAAKLNMSGTNYSKIERGEVPMTLVDFIHISKILKIKPAMLFEDKSRNNETIQEDMPGYGVMGKDMAEVKKDLKEIKVFLGIS